MTRVIKDYLADKLIHAYFGVDYEAVWALVTDRIPDIKMPLEKMIIEQSSNIKS